MEREMRRAGMLAAVADLFDLPGEILAHLPHLEMVGDRQLYLENHQGILNYSDSSIDINTEQGVLRLRGRGLNLLAITAEELRVGGIIEAVEWVV